VTNSKPIKIEADPWNGRDFSAALVLPPLSVVVFKIA
jgi:1,4-alpha-glucan branching enzyme